MSDIPTQTREPEPPIALLGDSSLFLDFDGTLVDIAPRPDAVEVTHELLELLGRLHDRLDHRVAILSGRSVAELEAFIGPLPLTIGGHHGLETRTNGKTETRIERPPSLDAIVAELRELERHHPGLLIEDKPLGVALHYRQAPQAEGDVHAAAERAARQSGMEMQPGKMVMELKPKGGNKGDALRSWMSEPPFVGSKPLFFGDDLTDEPAFAAAAELGGAGVIIGDRAPTQASYRLPSVDSALRWLDEAVASLS